MNNPLLTLLIPSYFAPTLYTKMGGGGHLDPPTISSTLDCRNLNFCKVLDKVSENTRFVKNLLHGYHGNCLITCCFSLIIVKTSMKNRYFSNAPRNHKLQGVKIKLCVMICVMFYSCASQKSNFKVGGSARFLGGTGGKIGLNVEKWSFSQGLNREFFQIVIDT